MESWPEPESPEVEVESWPEPESPEVEVESWPEPESRGGGGGRVGPSRRVPRWRWELARAGESRGGALESARAGESRASAGGGESARAGESRASAGGGESARGAAPRSSQKKKIILSTSPSLSLANGGLSYTLSSMQKIMSKRS